MNIEEKSKIIGEKNTDLIRLTQRLKLRFLTEISLQGITFSMSL
jgi:hypothetical protein